MGKSRDAPRANGESRTVGGWAKTPGEYIAGAAHLDEVDKVAAEVERRWGAGRVRMLVSIELREKFDRQRYLLNQAVFHGQLEAIRRETSRMCAAWRAVDRAAREAGADLMSPEVWEVALSDGRVLALARSNDDFHAYASAARSSGREVVLWSLEEVSRLIEADVFSTPLKCAFPGATVVAVRPIVDPLQSIPDSGDPLDDEVF